MTDPDKLSETYSEEETERRREAALKRMLATPHKPHKPHEKLKKGEKRK
jgi:hypothetical protein